MTGLLGCQCPGGPKFRDGFPESPCPRLATQEDLYCDTCRPLTRGWPNCTTIWAGPEDAVQLVGAHVQQVAWDEWRPEVGRHELA